MRPASCLCQYLKQYSEGATRYNVLGCLPKALCGLQVRVQKGVHGVVNMSPSRQLQLERIKIIQVQNFKIQECIKPQTSKLPTCSCFSSLLLLALCSQVSSAAGVVMTGVRTGSARGSRSLILWIRSALAAVLFSGEVNPDIQDLGKGVLGSAQYYALTKLVKEKDTVI